MGLFAKYDAKVHWIESNDAGIKKAVYISPQE